MRFLLTLSLLFLSLSLSAEELTFKMFGKEVKRLTLEDLRSKLKAEKIRVYEGHINGEATYEAYPFKDVLNLALGNEWKKGEDALVSCLDGYQPAIAVSQIEGHAGYIVVARTDGGEFGFKKNDNPEQVSFGPFYLVWENLKDKAMDAQGFDLWPYQMTSVDFIHFADKFPTITPPKNSSAAVKRGFTHFRTDCLHCHSINGEGSNVSVELNYPVNITEYFKESWLKRWILGPESVRFGAKMPALNEKFPNRESIVDDVIAYLKAMRKNKRSPKARR